MTPLTERQIALLKHTFIDFQQTSDFIQNPLKYFDAIGGIFVAVLGHRHPRLLKAMQAQMKKITFAPPLHGTTNVTLDFIEKLAGVTPGNLNYVKPFSGGSEAIECALKFVRQYYKQSGYPQKYKFISRYYGYHGGTFGAMAASGTGVRKTKFEPQMAGFLKVFPPNYYRERFDTWEACNRFSAQAFEDIIVHEDPSTVAGVIVEPVGNTGGIITPSDEYFKIIRETCDRYNVALIFDEVITGIAKTGAMFAAQKYGVTPDIICCGKGISSGMVPLGAMIAREDMADAFYGLPEEDVQFAHGHTFAGNPLACAVGIAVLDEIIENQLTDKAQALGAYLVEKLQKLMSFGVIREIRGKGILRGIELVRDTQSMEPFPELGAALKSCALKNGLILRVDPSWFAVAPPLIAEKPDIDEMCDRIERSLIDALEMVKA